MSLPYYKRYPRDFLTGTVGLTFEEKGAYSILLDLIYMHDGRLADDARFIAGNLNCSVRKWGVIRDRLIALRKIRVFDGLISNLRADNELKSSGKYTDKQRENRSNPNKNNELSSPKPHCIEDKTDTDTDNPPNPPAGGACSASPKFEEALSAYPAGGTANGRLDQAEALWGSVAAEIGEDVLLAAVKRYAVSDYIRRGGHPAKFQRWLANGGWRMFVDRPGAGAPASVWPGPADLRAKFAAALGEDWVASWLDHQGWQDLPTRAVVCATGFAAERIRRDARRLLASEGLTVIHERVAA